MGCSWKKRRHSRNVLKGLAAGAVAGLAASWAMHQYQKAWSAASGALANSTNGKSDKASEHSGEQDPTITIADKISRTVRGRSLRKHEQKKAGTLIHYAFGSVVSGLYGPRSKWLRSLSRQPACPSEEALSPAWMNE